MRARVDTIGGHCLAWLEVLFAVWCVGLLGLAGFWPLAFWTAGLSLGCVMLALLILCWFGAPCGMWDPDGVVKSPHDSSPSKSLMFHFQFCRPTYHLWHKGICSDAITRLEMWLDLDLHHISTGSRVFPVSFHAILWQVVLAFCFAVCGLLSVW
mgnify:CR=1 FL=1